MTTLAIVVSLVGQAWAENANGERRALEVGDELAIDETLIMAEGARIDLDFGDNQQLTFLGDQKVTPEVRGDLIEQTESLSSLETNDLPESVTPIESDRGGLSEGHSFVQLVRIGEIIEADGYTPVTVARIQEVLRPFGMSIPQREFVRSSERDGTRYDEQSAPESGSKLAKLSISIDAITGDDIVDATESGQPITLTGKVGGGVSPGDTVAVTVNGQLYNTTVNADGRTWQVDVPGSELAKDNKVQATVNSVEPNGTPVSESAERPYLADDITPSVSVELEQGSGPNGEFNESDTNDGKVEGRITFGPNSKPGDTITVTDKDGNPILDGKGDPITDYEITQGDIDNGITVEVPVTPGQTDVELKVDITDSVGNTSSASDNKAVDNVGPQLRVEIEGEGSIAHYDAAKITNGQAKVTVKLIAGAVEAGDQLIVRDGNGNTVINRPVTDAEVASGEVDVLLSVAQGQTVVNVEAVITDPAGNSSNDADGKVILSPDLAIDTAQIDDAAGTIDISGSTSDVAPGSDVVITITDKDGNTVSVTAQTNASGDYTITGQDISGLTDGPLDIKAETTDHNGKTVDDSVADAIDHIAGGLSVDTTTVASTGPTVDISGSSTDVHPGETVTVTITDQDGTTVTTSAIVQADGTYTVTGTDISSLVDGPLDITAEATDNNGNPVSGSDTAELDNLTGSMTVAFTNDPIADPALAEVTGTTADVAPGETVSLTFTDVNNQTTTATAVVASDGTYTTTVDLRGLTDGDITVDAAATDRNGDPVNATNNAELDAIVADIAIKGTSVDDVSGTIDISGSTTDVAPNTTVNITITDKDNNTVTTIATTDANGDYVVNGTDISGLTDGDLTITAETTDHNGNSITTSATDALNHVAGDLVVDTTTVDDANQTVDINGSTTDVHPGETVTITIKDQDGNTVTTSAIVQADGTYTVIGEDISSLVDGPLTIEASSTDNNGNPVSGSDNGELDNLAGSMTVAFTNDPIADPALAEVTGTTVDVAPGEIVNLTFTDQNSNTVATTAVVANDGTYTTTVDLRGLTDGNVTVVATATDRNSDPVTGSDSAELDAVAADIAIDTTSVDDAAGTIDISGSTTDVAPGSDVDITITDKDNNTVTVRVQTDATGNYTVTSADISGLTDGPLDIKAETTDHNGNAIDAAATDSMDHVAGGLAVDASTVDDAAQTIGISGSSTDVHPGETVTITIKDQDGNTVTNTATVQGDGSYSITGEDISSLVDGSLEITAEATDNNGNPVSDTHNDELDNITDTITVTLDDITSANESAVTVTGTTTDVLPGETVNLTFTDGTNTQTATATVAQDGSYQTNVDLSGLTDGSITVDAETEGRNGPITANDTASKDATAPTLEITSTEVVLASGETDEITFTFSEAVTGFDATDVNVAGGTLTNPVTTDGGTTWTADFTADGSGNISIKVADDSYTDVAGNPGTGDDHAINAAPSISAIDVNGSDGGNITVYEKGIGDANDNSETAHGTLRVTAPTGLESIEIGGVQITLAQLQAVPGSPQAIIISGHGQLTINGFTATAQVNGEDVQWDIDYTYELTAAQAHDSANPDELLKNIDLGVTAKDLNNAAPIVKNGSLGVLVVDDVPEVDLTGVKLDEAMVTEANLGTAATVDFSGAFEHSFGADDAAVNNSLVYELVVKDPASGLTDTATGQAINLILDGDEIKGVVVGSSDVAFTITLDPETGEVTLKQNRALEHNDPLTPNDFVKITNGAINIKATATDGDGDKASAEVNVGDRFVFQDEGPTIDATGTEITIDEAHLANGSDPQPGPLTSGKVLFTGINYGADGVGDVQFTETSANSTVEKLKAMGLESNQTALQYELSDGHTLIAYRGAGRAEGDKIFTVEIVDANTSTPGYQFTLNGPLDHLNEDGDQLTNLNLGFGNIVVTDGDGDSVETGFNVKVKNDKPDPSIPQTETTDEDTAVTFNSNADATKTNTTVGTGSTEDNLAPKFGTVTVEDNGQLTYTPSDDYSGEDKFTYTTTTDSGEKTYTVVMTVNPVADAPDIPHASGVGDENVSTTTVETDEDTSIALGLKAPIITDATQELGAAADFPERLGAITLSLTGDAIGTLTNAAGDVSYTDTGVSGEYKFVIKDVADLHLDGLTSAADPTVNYVTQTEYEAIKALPAADRHENFEVEVSVSSYEVDASGAVLPDAQVSGVNGAQSTQAITVDVHAVTDAVGLEVHQGAAQPNVTVAISGGDKVADVTLNEDNSFNLTSILNPDAFVDTDGSETRYLGIHGLPEGTTINVGGTDYVIGTDPITTFDFGDGKGDVPVIEMLGTQITLPEITITPPLDFSGDIKDITVTLGAIDSDSDSAAATPVLETNAVTIHLHVNPIAGDVIVGDVSTDEDTPVAFLEHIEVTDKIAGTEVITQVEFELPAGWKLTGEPTAGSAGDAVWTVTGNDNDGYTINFTDGTEANREAALKAFEVTPPAHSSNDETITVKVTTTDTNTVGGSSVTHTSETPFAIKVSVAPVAEKVGEDTDDDGTPDLTMMGDYTYQTDGSEDTWFDLGTDGGNFQFSGGWTNQDASEDTIAVLTPSLFNGDGSSANAIGSKFKWTEGGVEKTITYTGEPIDVPMSALDSLEFMTTKDFAGTFEIKVQAKTVDVNADDSNDTVEAISGEATLTSGVIKPVADTSTTSLTARVNGNEDEPMNLSIRPNSTDPNEIFAVTLNGIPNGATLTYGNYAITKDGVFDYTLVDGQVVVGSPATNAEVTVSPDGAGKWEVVFEDFDKNEDMTITAPLDSNEEFTLGVSTVTVDTIVVNGTTYTDRSDPESLDVIVSPKGVADPAEFELSTNLEYTEAQAESTGINVSDLIAKAELKDNDGSEALTFKLGNLPAGFEVEGATLIGGTGADREWSFNQTTLNNVIIKTPANYNGIVDFKIYTITTENDGDSLTEDHDVQLTITPTPEATMNLSASIDEDVSTALDFSVVHQNGDTDESISKVWIKVDSVKDGLTLTLGDGGPALSTTENIGGDDYYVVEQGDLGNIFAQGAANWHGTTDFDVKYEVTDPGNDGLTDVTDVFDGNYAVEVAAITDQVTLGITSGADTTLSEAGTVNVALTVGNDDGNGSHDYDGSEMLTRIIVEDVPAGVIITNPGSHLVGEGVWVLEIDQAMHGALAPQLGFDVHGSTINGEHDIKVTVVSEDAGNGTEATATETIRITTAFADPGAGEDPAVIGTWEQTTFEPTEDTGFTLDEAINAEIDATGVASNSFTVTLKDLPAGTTVVGMTRTVVNGEEIWSATSQGGDAELQTLLESITVTAPADFNSNQGQFEYTATLTTHVPSGGRAKADELINQTVIPVTDDAEIVISAPAVSEGNELAFNINISNPTDNPDWTIVGDKLYLQLNEPADLQGGKLMDGATELTTTVVNGVTDITDGDYYVVDLNGATTKDLTYVPKTGDEYKSGDVTLNAWVQGQEDNAANIVTTNVAQAGTINPVNNGYNLEVANVEGDENPTASDKEQAIRINVSGTGLVDDDGSEKIETITLKNVPNDFLIYAGSSASDATLQNMADNAGGTTTNTWILGNEMPEYIAILPPKHWSGTIEELTLSVISGETSLTAKDVSEATFDFTVKPVADGVELSPTPSFGTEGEIIDLNLNARLTDLEQAGPSDESTESVSLQLKGLGAHAAFYIDRVLSMDDVVYDDVEDTYTITGLSQSDSDNLGFIQANDAITEDIEVRAQSVESGDTNNPSAWTDWKSVTTNVTSQTATSNDDTLLWNGGLINGRGGDDTIQLRFGEDVSANDLATNLSNVEVLDLSIAGDNTIGDVANGLSLQDVLDMTDSRNELTIDGDDYDTVHLSSGEWTTDSVAVGGYITYTDVNASSNAQLLIAETMIVIVID